MKLFRVLRQTALRQVLKASKIGDSWRGVWYCILCCPAGARSSIQSYFLVNYVNHFEENICHRVRFMVLMMLKMTVLYFVGSDAF